MILFGALFAVFSKNDRQGAVFSDGYFWHGIVFTTIFNVPVVYAVFKYPDWMWMYFLENSHNTPLELIYIFLFLYYLPYVLGFTLGRDLKHFSVPLWFLFLLSQIGTEVWLIGRLFARYSVIGTREEFLSGQAVALFGPDNPIALVMNSSVAVMIAYFLLVVFFYRRPNKIL
jgi:hypothetical protein